MYVHHISSCVSLIIIVHASCKLCEWRPYRLKPFFLLSFPSHFSPSAGAGALWVALERLAKQRPSHGLCILGIGDWRRRRLVDIRTHRSFCASDLQKNKSRVVVRRTRTTAVREAAGAATATSATQHPLNYDNVQLKTTTHDSVVISRNAPWSLVDLGGVALVSLRHVLRDPTARNASGKSLYPFRHFGPTG